jgi:crotonobetainyl-CoA:carnitine CoA-transferase CaiB-like acyl-CoA transferase
MTTPSALTGIRVIDFATSRAELAGRVLADLGAEVIKVEPPGGCESRALPPFANDTAQGSPTTSLYWATVGLGKRSVVTDLERADDRAALTALIDGADILIESFDRRHESIRTWLALAARNPGLIYTSVTRLDKPDRQRRRRQLISRSRRRAASSACRVTGPAAACHWLPQAVSRRRTGRGDPHCALRTQSQRVGQHLDVSMQAAIVGR